MSAALEILDTKAGAVIVGGLLAAAALFYLSGRIKDAVVTKAPSLYQPGKEDSLLFGVVNLDEPFALTRRIGTWLGDLLPSPSSPQPADQEDTGWSMSPYDWDL